MRYPASEKAEIIHLVEQSHLPAKRTLDKLGIPRPTFYRRYDQYREGGLEALADHRPGAGSSRTVAARAGRTVHRRDGELLKLGFELAQSSVAKYMVKRREPSNQGWRTFLHTQLGRTPS